MRRRTFSAISLLCVLFIAGVLISRISMSFAATTQGLVAYYPFNGNANDESGNGNQGTVYGASLTPDKDGQTNSAYSFDGVNDYIHIPYNQNFDINPNGFTVAHWIKVDPSQGEDLWCTIDKSHGGPASDKTGWAMQGSVSQNVLGLAVGNGSGWGGQVVGQLWIINGIM
jgi:hypothetical protein